MKNYYAIFLLLFITNPATSQWQWAKQIGGLQFDNGKTLIDNNDNNYCIGVFEGSCYFENDTLHSWGVNDIFISKYDASGNELWVKGIGGNNPMNFTESIRSAVIDNSNSCFYVAGKFYGTLIIDAHTISGAGGIDLFLAKFDLNGNCIWLRRAASTLEDLLGTISLDPVGNIYWSGSFHHASGLVDTVSVSSGWFLAKFDSSGNLISTIPNFIEGGAPSAIEISNNEIIVAGSTGSFSLIIDSDTFSGSSLVDAFLVKMDLNLSLNWAKRFGGNSSNWDHAGNFERDTNGNIYLVGSFEDSLTIEGTTLTNPNKKDMFFAKFDSSGNLIWVKQTNATGSMLNFGDNIVRDIDGSYYIVGSISGNATFGNFNITTTNAQEIFIARYDENGDCIGIRHLGWAEGKSVSIDNSGNVIVAGLFINTINLGSIALTSHGGGDMFFAKTDAITGVEETERRAGHQLIIYANPNQGKCNIIVPEDFLNEEKLILSIFDNAGRLIQSQNLEFAEGKIKLNLEQEAKGIYGVSLSNGKRSYSGRIVFE